LGADIEKISTFLSIHEEDVYLPVQQHTDTVLVLDSEMKPRIADSVVTRRKGILIGVQVADCIPILLSDRKKSVIGAVHAGWRGTALQIIIKTINAMAERFRSSPDDIVVALGPSIRGNCYQVGGEVKDAVLSATGDGGYHVRKNGKYFIDLPSANILQAMSAGIPEENIWCSPECTHCNPLDFHSFRYHKNHSGRQGGFIGIF
jgi:YfiH family protein